MMKTEILESLGLSSTQQFPVFADRYGWWQKVGGCKRSRQWEACGERLKAVSAAGSGKPVVKRCEAGPAVEKSGDVCTGDYSADKKMWEQYHAARRAHSELALSACLRRRFPNQLLAYLRLSRVSDPALFAKVRPCQACLPRTSTCL